MTHAAPCFRTRFAQTPDDVRAAQRLRYGVFVQELGATGDLVDHCEGTEADPYDAHADHLLLEDLSRANDTVIGVYRLMTTAQARRAGGFASAQEFDLALLTQSGRPLLELGRSCLLPAYRGGPAMGHLFAALGDHIGRMDQAILFGVASFHGTDVEALSRPLAYLCQNHLAPQHIRAQAIGPSKVPMPQDAFIDRKAALREVPPLIKAYLRLGGVVGEGACIDAVFNTTDVCMILDTAAMTPSQRARFAPDPHS